MPRLRHQVDVPPPPPPTQTPSTPSSPPPSVPLEDRVRDLVSRYSEIYSQVERWVRRSTKKPIDVESLVMEVIEECLLTPTAVWPPTKWLTTRRTIDTCRRYHPTEPVPTTVEAHPTNAGAASLIEAVIDHAGLTSRERDVIYYTYYGGLLPDEIANVLGLSTSVVRNTLHTTLRRLRQILDVLEEAS